MTKRIVAIILTVVIPLGGIGWWLRGQFSNLESRLSDLDKQLSTQITDVRADLLKDIDGLAQRIAKIEGRLQIATEATMKQLANLERQVALSDLSRMVTSYTPAAFRHPPIYGTVEAIDLKKKVLTVRDASGRKVNLSIAPDAVVRRYSSTEGVRGFV